ncbi:unnamed protein product [Tilletia controversa]|nr:hypothetical protein CF328_g1328 [Tilletia controversa]CAD6926963.1 unnamed protein product [Tilletia controversa]CAD6954782.1 unnamed protein product [Tilletia controversa]CAD6981002.1 unnamed protein product [Tilletia controversa]
MLRRPSAAAAVAATTSLSDALTQLLPPLAPAFFLPSRGPARSESNPAASPTRTRRRTLSTTAASRAAASALAKENAEDSDRPHRSAASASSFTTGSGSSESIYPSSQAALRPNPNAKSPLYRHTRARKTGNDDGGPPVGFLEPPEVARLNEALRGAVTRAREEVVANILHSLEHLDLDKGSEKLKSMLPFATTSATDATQAVGKQPQSDSVRSAPEPILSTAFTRNWSPITYHHVLAYCVATGRAEFGLAVLGSAFHQAGKDLNALGSIFPPSACGSLVRVLLATREARLAYEVATWLNSGDLIMVKKSHWYAILLMCAKQHYLPGVIGAWKRTLMADSDLIDEGLALQILSTASRSGDTDFCIEVLRRTISAPHNATDSPPLVLHQGLLAPLFEAYCAASDLESAIRLLSRMQAAGMEVKRHAATPLSTAVAAALTQNKGDSATQMVVQQIMTALRNVGSAFVERNLVAEFPGIHVSAFNAVIVGAIWAKRVDVAHDIYKARMELLGIEDGAARLFDLEQYLLDNRPDVDAHASAHVSSPPGVIAERLKQQRLLPDLNTFHALISACADTGEIRLARKLLQDLNGYNLEPTADTYQRLVKLCLACAPHVYKIQQAEAAHAKAEAEAEIRAFSDRPFGAETMASSRVPGSSSADPSSTTTSASAPGESSAPRPPGSEPSYEDAFKLLDECKKRNLKPTQATYEALIWRCWREHDERWHELYLEMKEQARYVPSWPLLNALEPGLRAVRESAAAEAEIRRGGLESRRGSNGASGDMERGSRTPVRRKAAVDF